MKTAPAVPKCSNPDVKQVIIPFPRLETRNLEKGQYHTYKLCTTPADATSPVYELLGQNVTQGPASYVVAKTLVKGNALTVFERAEIARGNPTVPYLNKCLDDVTEHVFPEKA
eukprot:12137696-Ditylum_brightwellii.AAC.1